MRFIRGFMLVYAGAGAIASLIHMWRNRRKREIMGVYAWTFALEVLLFVGYWWGWR